MPSENSEQNILSAVRGARDFLPEEKMLRDAVSQRIVEKFRLYGFVPIETPSLERLETLSSKFAGGEEILKETFKLEDQGGRKLGLRYDLTVPLCRVMAANPKMPMPFKRYCIAPVWRDGPLKTGRYREFWQCDADVIGSASLLADAEVLSLACDVLSSIFKEKFFIKINNRKILDSILDCAGIPLEKRNEAILALDKLAKIGLAGVEKELQGKGIAIGNLKEFVEKLTYGSSNFILDNMRKLCETEEGKEGIRELEELLKISRKMGFDKSIRIDGTLARGLNYYTGNIFEAYLEGSAITSSIAAGGRYDDLIGTFSGSERKIPAVGISFGLDVICEALKLEAHKARELSEGTSEKVFVIPIIAENSSEAVDFSLGFVSMLRNAGIPSSIDLMQRSISRNLEYASKRRAKFAAIIGERELKEKKILIRNLETGEEKNIPSEEAAEFLKR